MSPVLFLFVLFTTTIYQVDAGNYGHFLGGTISFSVRHESNGSIFADLDVITGWILQKGPCGNSCTKVDIGVQTNSRRNSIINRTGDPFYFGTWTVASGSGVTKNLTSTIRSNMSEVVLAVNEKSQWEQEQMKVSVELSATQLDKKESVGFDGGSWHTLTLQHLSNIAWHLNTKIEKQVRNDTGLTNRSPLVFIKPLYRIKRRAVNKISLSVTDPDGDLANCTASEFREGGVISRNPIPGLSVTGDCVVTIDADATNYQRDAFVAIAVTVRDYNRHTIKLGTKPFQGYSFSLSDTSAQFLVQVKDTIDGPVFVDPTSKANHHFILYAETVWRQRVYAKADVHRTIADFIVVGRQQEIIKVSPTHDGDNPRVKYVDIEWIPKGFTRDSHVICISAIDDYGMDSNEDRCFTIQTKPDKFHHSLSPGSSRPYFIDLPSTDQLVQCEMDVTCVLPLYVVSSIAIDKIRYTSSFFSDTAFGDITKKQHNGRSVYESDLSFRDSVDGVKKICLVATDVHGQDSDESCIQSALQPLDPCASSPCNNGATCSRSGLDAAVYNCQCMKGFTGRSCKTKADLCTPDPCNGGHCFNIYPKFFCQCTGNGFSGPTCSIAQDKCKPDPCKGHGHCDAGNCSCYGRYSGKDCSLDRCPNTTHHTETTCGVQGCTPDPCNGHGLCIVGGQCICSIGYRGDPYCNNGTGNAVSLQATSGTKFIPPTPPARSLLQCYLKKPCKFSVFIATSDSSVPLIKVDRSSSELKNYTISPVTETQDIHGVNELYTAEVIMTSAVATGTLFVCLTTATSGPAGDRMCWEVTFKRDPSDSSGTVEFNHKQDTYKFIEPTPNGDSRFICYVGKECSLILHTNVVNGTCEDVVSGEDNVYVLPANNGSDCLTEVFFNFSTEGSRRICFVASTKQPSQSRCYHFEVYIPQTDYISLNPKEQHNVCAGSPCQYGGDCFHRGKTELYCACQAGYKGHHCEKGKCSIQEDNCDTSAFCYVDNHQSHCICPVGMTGSQCKDRSTSAIPKSAFTDTALPMTVTCVAKRLCTIPLGVSTRAPQRSSLEFGYVSSGIRTQGVVTERTLTDTMRATVSITPLEVGEKLVCVQTIVNKANEDEVCVNVTVTTDFATLYGSQDKPHFIAPSLPANALVRCPIDEPCHMLFHVTPGKGNEKKCNSVYFTASPLEYSNVFSTCSNCQAGQGSSNCSIDVSMIPTNSSYIGKEVKVCLAVELTASQLKGEERCFNVAVQAKADFRERKGCQILKCSNGGFCDSHVNPPVCFCPPGFKGSTCDTPKSGGGSTVPGSFITDFGVPSQFLCSLNSSCYVNFHIAGPSKNMPCVEIGYIDTDLAIEQRPTVSMEADGIGYTGSVVVRPKQVKNSKMCLQTQSSGRVDDEICVSIQVVGNPAPDIDQNKPYFLNHSLARGTTVLCEAGHICYTELYFPTGSTFNSMSSCPNIELTSAVSTDGIHVFIPKANGDICKVTIAFLTTSGNVGNKERICIQVAVPGKPGEERCFNIETKVNIQSHVIGPCRGKTCNANTSETCIANLKATPTAVCIKGSDHGAGTSRCDGKTSQQVGKKNDEPEAPKSNVALFAGAGAGGAVVMAGVGVGVCILVKKSKKPKISPDETDLPEKK